MSETETRRDWCVECPRCFHCHHDTCDYKHDQQRHEAECVSCRKPFGPLSDNPMLNDGARNCFSLASKALEQ